MIETIESWGATEAWKKFEAAKIDFEKKEKNLKIAEAGVFKEAVKLATKVSETCSEDVIKDIISCGANGEDSRGLVEALQMRDEATHKKKEALKNLNKAKWELIKYIPAEHLSPDEGVNAGAVAVAGSEDEYKRMETIKKLGAEKAYETYKKAAAALKEKMKEVKSRTADLIKGYAGMVRNLKDDPGSWTVFHEGEVTALDAAENSQNYKKKINRKELYEDHEALLFPLNKRREEARLLEGDVIRAKMALVEFIPKEYIDDESDDLAFRAISLLSQ